MDSLSSTTTHLLIALLALSVFAILVTIGLFTVRYYRRRSTLRASAPILPTHRNASMSSIRKPHHRRSASVNISPMSFAAPVLSEKESLLSPAQKRESVAVPEIRITFPEEVDSVSGKRQSRVVVVKLADNGSVGMQPCDMETLSSKRASSEWKSLDLEKMGGLRDCADQKSGGRF
jgi:hypothetical protein